MLVVVTREAGRNDEVVHWLPGGATVVEAPATETRYRPLGEVVADLARARGTGRFAAVVVTSARTRDYVDAALAVSRRDVALWSVGPATTASLAGLGVDVAGEAETAGAIGERVEHGPVLVLGARAMRGELAARLAARGIETASVACYETVALALAPTARSALARADAVVVGAPSAWAVVGADVARSAWVVVPGATTEAVVRADHERVLVGWDEAAGRRLAELVAGDRTAEGP